MNPLVAGRSMLPQTPSLNKGFVIISGKEITALENLNISFTMEELKNNRVSAVIIKEKFANLKEIENASEFKVLYDFVKSDIFNLVLNFESYKTVISSIFSKLPESGFLEHDTELVKNFLLHNGKDIENQTILDKYKSSDSFSFKAMIREYIIESNRNIDLRSTYKIESSDKNPKIKIVFSSIQDYQEINYFEEQCTQVKALKAEIFEIDLISLGHNLPEFIKLFQCIKDNSEIGGVKLYLKNDIKDNDIKSLSDALKGVRLQYMALPRWGYEKIMHFFENPEIFSSLKTLDLSNTSLYSIGNGANFENLIQSIFNNINSFESLKELHLNDNNGILLISDNCIEILANFITQSPVEKLNLSGNDLGYLTNKKLQNLLLAIQSSKILEFNLSDNFLYNISENNLDILNLLQKEKNITLTGNFLEESDDEKQQTKIYA